MNIPLNSNGEPMSINEEAAVRGLNPATIYRRRKAAGLKRLDRLGRSGQGRKRRFFVDQIDWSKSNEQLATELGVKAMSVVAVRWQVFGKAHNLASYIIEQEINRGR